MMELFIFASVGAIMGSFANMLVYRLPREMSLVGPSSHCTLCKNYLNILDLIPIFSWVLRLGKCHYCQEKIAVRYLLLEIISLLIFVLCAAYYPILDAAILAVIIWLLLCIIIIDLEHYIIPDELNLALFVMGQIYIYYQTLPWLDRAMVALGLALMFLTIGAIISWIKKRDAIGYGDIKLLLAAGWLVVPLNVPYFILLSGLIGVVCGIIWQLILKKPVFPFAPALCLSFIACLFLDISSIVAL